MIIKKICDIENLEKNEVELLMSMVKDLYDEVKNSRKKSCVCDILICENFEPV